MRVTDKEIEKLRYILNFLQQEDNWEFSMFELPEYNNENRLNHEIEFNKLANILYDLNIVDFKPSDGAIVDMIFRNSKTLSANIDDIIEDDELKAKDERLEKENIALQNKSLKHQDTIKDQEQRIRDLTEKRLRREMFIAIGFLLLGSFLQYFVGTLLNDRDPDQIKIQQDTKQKSENLNSIKLHEQKPLITNQKDTINK